MKFDKNLIISTITDWRHLRKLTVKQLADLAEIPQPTLSSFLSGKVDKPSFETICAICNALEHPITQLQAILRYTEYRPTESKGTKFLLHKEERYMRDLDLMRNEQLTFYKTRLDDQQKLYDTVVSTKNELIDSLKHQIRVMDKLLQNLEKKNEQTGTATSEAEA